MFPGRSRPVPGRPRAGAARAQKRGALLVALRNEARQQAPALALGELIEAGKFVPVIDRTWALDRIADAFRYDAGKTKIGNVVIQLE
jgi:NADPH:quinone reductase-like Zn-dependent oxidoreductase